MYSLFKISQSAPDGVIKEHEKDAGMGNTEIVQEMSIKEYDRNNFVSFSKQQAIQCAIVIFMHLKFNFSLPLILSSIMGIMGLFDNEIVRIYLLGSPLILLYVLNLLIYKLYLFFSYANYLKPNRASYLMTCN